MDVNDQIHAQLVKAGVRLAATLPDDWVNSLIRRVAKDNVIRHVSVGREAETIAVCAGAFFGGVRAVAIIEQIAAATHQVMADKEFQKRLILAGFEPVTDSGPEQTAKFIQEELVRWTPLLKASGLKMN